MNRLLTGKETCKKLNIGPDTLRKLRKSSGFPGFFWRKYYSEPEIDAWLRSRLSEQQKQNSFDIESAAEAAIGELFGGDLFSPNKPTSPGERSQNPAPLKLAE